MPARQTGRNDEEERAMSERGLSDPISRRDLIKAGLAGAAGLTALPALIAACNAAGTTATPAAPSTPTAPITPTASPIPSGFLRRKLSGQLKVADGHWGAAENPDPAERAGMDAVDAAFEELTGLRPTLNAIDPLTYQEHALDYLQGTPDDLFTWATGYRMRFFVQKGLILPIDEVWAAVKGNFTPGLAGAVTGDDGRVYGIPVDSYPWAMFYRKSIWTAHGYEVPTTWDQLLALCARMKQDGLTPIAFGDMDGWPAAGFFDMLNLRLNGYQFHMDLLRGKEYWTDPRVTAVFKEWAKLVAYYSKDFQKLTWQQACDTLVREGSGMYYVGLFMTGEVAAIDKSVLDDIDFFEFPYFGNEFDAERAVEAPVDVWAMAARSPTLDADADNARAYLEFWAQGSTQLLMFNSQPSLIPMASDVDVSKLDRLSAKSVQLIGRARRITNFFDRDTRNDWVSPSGGVEGFLIRFLMDPGLDLAQFQQQIQRFWDALPPYGS
jgi:multiple sugar transport system substrate-binding protein